MTDAHDPVTDLVILAGGQARRMQGLNKLLQCFDKQIQLLKISQHFRGKVQQQWINSNRDHRKKRTKTQKPGKPQVGS